MKKTKLKINKPVYLGLSILEPRKHKCLNFGMIILNLISKQCKTMLYGY